jgi:hypothetical protein
MMTSISYFLAKTRDLNLCLGTALFFSTISLEKARETDLIVTFCCGVRPLALHDDKTKIASHSSASCQTVLELEEENFLYG